jgi:hypothetical protein
MSLDNDFQKKYTGKGSLNNRQVDRVKAITKSLQKINCYSDKNFFIVVEGKDDIPLYSPVFTEKQCKLIPLWGVDNVKYIFKKLKTRRDQSKPMRQVLELADNQEKINKLSRMRDENKIIGIIDLDFEKEKCSNNEYSTQDYSNLFVTETNDGQILLLSNYGLIIFIKELCDQEKVKEFKKRNKIEQLFKQIIIMTNYSGLARYLNKKFGKEKKDFQPLKFRILDPEDIFYNYIAWDRVLTDNDIIKLLFHEESNNDYNADFIKEYAKKKSNLEYYFPNRWDVCQGHDMTKVLLSIHRLVGCGKNYTQENDLIDDICNIFHSPKNAFFNKTSLFTALKRWEREKFPYSESGMFSEIYSQKEVK